MSGIDPVCGKEVDRDEAERALLVIVHAGVSYYFCANDCKRRFESSPAFYAERAGLRQSPEEEGEVDRAWE